MAAAIAYTPISLCTQIPCLALKAPIPFSVPKSTTLGVDEHHCMHTKAGTLSRHWVSKQ